MLTSGTRSTTRCRLEGSYRQRDGLGGPLSVHEDGMSVHNSGMSRIRVSTTVDETLLENARRLRSKLTDSALLDEALEALLARHRAAEIDPGYSAYDEAPTSTSPYDWVTCIFRGGAATS